MVLPPRDAALFAALREGLPPIDPTELGEVEPYIVVPASGLEPKESLLLVFDLPEVNDSRCMWYPANFNSNRVLPPEAVRRAIGRSTPLPGPSAPLATGTTQEKLGLTQARAEDRGRGQEGHVTPAPLHLL